MGYDRINGMPWIIAYFATLGRARPACQLVDPGRELALGISHVASACVGASTPNDATAGMLEVHLSGRFFRIPHGDARWPSRPCPPLPEWERGYLFGVLARSRSDLASTPDSCPLPCEGRGKGVGYHCALAIAGKKPTPLANSSGT